MKDQEVLPILRREAEQALNSENPDIVVPLLGQM